MNQHINTLLNNKGENYIFPFLWLRGEPEAKLREYMGVIFNCGIHAVCIESRPHPDFCGPGWWHDLDIILDEARNRNMKVWILDDSHFPTGYANGAMKSQPSTLHRQSIFFRKISCEKGIPVTLTADMLLKCREVPEAVMPFPPPQSGTENAPEDSIPMPLMEPQTVFDDDQLLSVVAVQVNTGEQINIMPLVRDSSLTWTAPDNDWCIYILHLSRNMGPHRDYINMMDAQSCRVLLDAVYEQHYQHYAADFGSTIAGFFSDEPELGNGRLYDGNTRMGQEIDQPWSLDVETRLSSDLGPDYATFLWRLWENDADPDTTARIRYAYMNAVTRSVQENFSYQIGHWCHAHHVQYIGHVIEDNDQHARTGTSLGHYFRGLDGQDMSGIDNIGGQVYPQQEDVSYDRGIFEHREGPFYHFMLGKLASSAAAISPRKNGNAMCEIFGGYGWSAGVQLQKYLIDHFLVRGINHFVPHAFSAREYPDPDCPPHFYANGHNPQFRHFGALMQYTNRVCELITGGIHIADVGIIYHAEAEWTGTYQPSHAAGRLLAEHQIDYDYLPQDIFIDREFYHTCIENGKLQVNTQRYRCLLIPESQYITAELSAALQELKNAGIQVYFLDAAPKGICNGTPDAYPSWDNIPVVPLTSMITNLKETIIPDIEIFPENADIRYYHYEHLDGTGVLLLSNEAAAAWTGNVRFQDARKALLYDPWLNTCKPCEYAGGTFQITLEPRKLQAVLLDQTGYAVKAHKPGQKISIPANWMRSICAALDYPHFSEAEVISLPDHLADESPEFSGFVRYDCLFSSEFEGPAMLEISDAAEGVEVFLDGTSSGIQVVPPYRFPFDHLTIGTHTLRIEVATTLERENAVKPDMFGKRKTPQSGSGLTGEVQLYAMK